MRDVCLLGDCRESMREMIAAGVRVQMCVTSPPYWALRDYGVEGQLGLESTPEEYVANMVEVFRLVRELLGEDGTLWLNLGSSYASGDIDSSQSRPHARAYGSDGIEPQDSRRSGLSCHDLCDECLGDFLSHHDHSVGNNQLTERSSRPPLRKVRDNALSDCASASADALLLDVLESSTLESWLQRRGACSRCDSRAFALSGAHSSVSDVRLFAGMTWLNYTRRLKQKDLVPIPWMVAMALQADGWYLRSDIIWAKPNPMPESVTDRPTKAHEYLFLLSKRERYYYDAEAIKENFADERRGNPGGGNWKYVDGNARGRIDSGIADLVWNADGSKSGRNRRSVWTIATEPYAEAHFATFPTALVEPCVLAGSRVGDIVFDPFLGSGTVAQVAQNLGRHWLGCELNPEYVKLQAARTAQLGLVLA